MKAMILAAGLGTRLRPLTNDRPKALVELAGRTLLEITLHRLRAAGVTEVIVNTHHFADRIEEFLRTHPQRDLRVEISNEPILLDTGGGLKHAAWFFDDGQPFILHNVDILTNIDLAAMLRIHLEQNALAVLATQDRPTSRPLLFDERLNLCGRIIGAEEPQLVRPVSNPQALAFSGIHIISSRIFDLMSEEGVFSIIPSYLRFAAQGHTITAFRADEYYWRDLGRPEHLEKAGTDIAAGLLRSS